MSQSLKSEIIQSSDNSSLTKWQLALIISAPVVICVGIGYWYYKSSSKSNINKKDLKNNSTSVKKIATQNENLNDPFEKALAYKNKGNKLFKGGKYEEAIDCYSKAIKECPKHKTDDLAIFYQNRAAAFEMLKNYKEVITDCTKALELKKDYVKALVRRAKNYEEIKDFEKSLNDITAACIVENFANESNLFMTDRIMKTHSKEEGQEYFKTKPSHIPSKTFISHYFSSYSRDPLIKDKQIPSSLDELEKIHKTDGVNEDSPIIILLRATVNILKGKIKEGEKDLQAIVQLNDCHVDIKVNALIKLATLKVHDINEANLNDNINEALQYFEQALKLDSENPDIYLHRAQIYILADKIKEAMSDLEKACSLNESFTSAIAQKHYVQVQNAVKSNDTRSIKKFMKEFEETMEKFPNSSELPSLYAQILIEQREFEEADKYYAKAIESDPNDGTLFVHRGVLYMTCMNKIDEALKFFEKAKEIDPSCQYAYEMLGSIDVQRGNLEKAIDHFNKALELAQTEVDCVHILSLRNAAAAQVNAMKMLGIEIPNINQ